MPTIELSLTDATDAVTNAQSHLRNIGIIAIIAHVAKNPVFAAWAVC